MVNNQLNSYSTFHNPTNYDEIGEISLKQARVLPYFRIKSMDQFNDMIYDPTYFSKLFYMKWYIFQGKAGDTDPLVPQGMGVRNCIREDFKGFEYIFDKVKEKRSLICPDDVNKLQL